MAPTCSGTLHWLWNHSRKEFHGFVAFLFHVEIAFLCFKNCKQKILLALKGITDISNHCKECNSIIGLMGCGVVCLQFDLGLHSLCTLAPDKRIQVLNVFVKDGCAFYIPLNSFAPDFALYLGSIGIKVARGSDSGELTKLNHMFNVSTMFVLSTHICGYLLDGFVVDFGSLSAAAIEDVSL